ncbi:hypothetical protein RCL_jg5950.t2 [Rhizophagus clarus]|uniref:Uncharacterized protein n=1 Tax=Rhizophagus clarus TaxID=94130 RepID=A0A8H3QWI4_9GLOM|nr:hypothetical protein RCL_jg5950.t2 [Rhizophagus clarus]
MYEKYTYFSEKYWEWPWKIWKILGNGLKDFRNHQGTAWRPRELSGNGLETSRNTREQSWRFQIKNSLGNLGKHQGMILETLGNSLRKAKQFTVCMVWSSTSKFIILQNQKNSLEKQVQIYYFFVINEVSADDDKKVSLANNFHQSNQSLFFINLFLLNNYI